MDLIWNWTWVLSFFQFLVSCSFAHANWMVIHRLLWMPLTQWFQKWILRSHQWGQEELGRCIALWNRCRGFKGLGLPGLWPCHHWFSEGDEVVNEKSDGQVEVNRRMNSKGCDQNIHRWWLTFLCIQDVLHAFSNLDIVFCPFGVLHLKIYHTLQKE